MTYTFKWKKFANMNVGATYDGETVLLLYIIDLVLMRYVYEHRLSLFRGKPLFTKTFHYQVTWIATVYLVKIDIWRIIGKGTVYIWGQFSSKSV